MGPDTNEGGEVDPAVSRAASADRSALVVLGRVLANPERERGGVTSTPSLALGVRPATEIRVLAYSARRVAAPDLVGLIEEFDRQWNPR